MDYFIQLHSGGKFIYSNMLASDIDIADISRGLSHIARFCGSTRFHYSVGQHSILVSKLLQRLECRPIVQLVGLLHDAHEAYMNDIPTPFEKWMEEDILNETVYERTGSTTRPFTGVLKDIKHQMDINIFDELAPGYKDMTREDIVTIKKMDMAALVIEAHYVFPEVPTWVYNVFMPTHGLTTDDCPYESFPVVKTLPEQINDDFLKIYKSLQE